jgi:hypothetical protein
MRLPLIIIQLFCQPVIFAQTKITNLPIWNNEQHSAFNGDWLVKPVIIKAQALRSADGKDLVLYNGLVKRSFRLQPNVACTGYVNLTGNQQLLRAVKAEARVSINGFSYNIGGLYGQKEQAYFRSEWVDALTPGENDFQFTALQVTPIKPYINWKQNTWAFNNKQAAGIMVSFQYISTLAALNGITINVNYELYDGIPLMVKWISITNQSNHTISIGNITNEILAVVEEESAVVGTPEQMKKQHGIYVETNYAFNNAMRYDISDQTTHWKTDSVYTSQVNYNYQTPCLLEVSPEKVTAVDVPPGETFKSVRTHELLMDSYDRERRGLAIRNMYSKVAPWTTANPIFMHLISRNNDEVYQAIDQCAATGYEAIILSFGSHCNMEDTSAGNIANWKKMADYAHSKHILIGSYSLFSSRRISDEDDVIDPVSGKPDAGAFFGNAPCLGSNWGLAYISKLKYFISKTGFNLFENDGPYPGDVCASTKHPGHKNLDDSQWKQMELQKGLYRWCNENGVYVNAPDWYFLDGTNKIALGYREVNFSLSRSQQKIINRQNIYDGLWEKTASMSWGFVPLTRYQGGDESAILEPLSKHLNDYENLMMQYYGAGVQACYRGPRLYDADTTKQTVIKAIGWYKKYRDILNASIIHLRRADGRDWDGVLHVSPSVKQKGLLMVYNPLKEKIERKINLPLYYTGATNAVRVREKEGILKKYLLNRNYEIELTVSINAESYNWYVIE